MQANIYYIVAILCLAMSSCKNSQLKEEHISDLDEIQIIYCTPKEFGKCLPLELDCYFDGWRARYVGAPSKESITLKPSYEVNKGSKSSIVLNEYLEDGRPNGKYILHSSPMFVDTFDGVSYIDPQGNDTIDFYTVIIKDGTVFTANSDVKEAIRKTMEYEGNDPVGCGTMRRDLNMSYLIHSNPDALHKPIKVDDLQICDSPDGKLRIYTFVGYTGGNGVGSNYDVGILQYETGNGEVAVLDNFTTLLYSSLVDFSGANFPYCTINGIRVAKMANNTYYLIEASFNDARPMFFNGNDKYFKTDDTVLYAFTIKKGKLTPAHIFDNKWLIEVVGSQETPKLRFSYDDATKTISVPVLEESARLFKGKYKKIKIQ